MIKRPAWQRIATAALMALPTLPLLATLTLAAWLSVWNRAATVAGTALLGLADSVAALVGSVAWLELAPAAWDRRLRPLVCLPLAPPAVLWVVGLHATLLPTGLDGGWPMHWPAFRTR